MAIEEYDQCPKCGRNGLPRITPLTTGRACQVCGYTETIDMRGQARPLAAEYPD